MSFKLKLVGYFLLVSVLPLGAAGWALHSIERSSETRRVDVRLEAGLRAVLATYKGQLASADHRARKLSPSTATCRRRFCATTAGSCAGSWQPTPAYVSRPPRSASVPRG